MSKETSTPESDATLSKEECKLESKEKGFDAVGPHRCDQEDKPGSNKESDKKWAASEDSTGEKKASAPDPSA